MQNNVLIHAPLEAPKAAAVAGIVSSILLLVVFWLLRISVARARIRMSPGPGSEAARNCFRA